MEESEMRREVEDELEGMTEEEVLAEALLIGGRKAGRTTALSRKSREGFREFAITFEASLIKIGRETGRRELCPMPDYGALCVLIEGWQKNLPKFFVIDVSPRCAHCDDLPTAIRYNRGNLLTEPTLRNDHVLDGLYVAGQLIVDGHIEADICAVAGLDPDRVVWFRASEGR